MKKRTRVMVWMVVVLGALGAYPAFVLLYTWSHVVRADFPGGGNGPLDAYRHTLAGAVVAYTVGTTAVEVVTRIAERRRDKDSNRMDRHNNRIGARIGSQVGAFSEIVPAVAQQVSNGTVNATSEYQTTWLPEHRWRKRRLW